MDDHDGVAVGICGTDRGRAGRDGGIAERLALAAIARARRPRPRRSGLAPNPTRRLAEHHATSALGWPKRNRPASPRCRHPLRTNGFEVVGRERAAAPPHGFDQRRTQRTVQRTATRDGSSGAPGPAA